MAEEPTDPAEFSVGSEIELSVDELYKSETFKVKSGSRPGMDAACTQGGSQKKAAMITRKCACACVLSRIPYRTELYHQGDTNRPR